MPERYSLLRHAWIPVALSEGQRAFVRPCDISEPHEGRDILRIDTGRPDCDIALTEFLIGLLAVTMDGTSVRNWHKRYRTPPMCDELAERFAPLEPAMMLDGDGPRFFQDREELPGEPTGIAALLVDSPGSSTIAQNADHFVKRGRTEALSRASAAVVLMTLQTSSPSGGAGHRTSLRGGGPLTTLVLPGRPEKAEPTLWQILWSNVPDGLHADPSEYHRVFPWLAPTRVSDRGGVTTTPQDVHPAQAFFGLPRRIRLRFEPNAAVRPCDLTGLVDTTIVTGYVTRPWGTNYEAWSEGHPLSPYYKVKATDAEFLPLHLQSARVGYRQWLGMVLETQDGLRVPARCVADFPTRAQNLDPDEKTALLDSRMLAAGYAMDNMKPLDFAEAVLPLIVTGGPETDLEVKEMARAFVMAADTVASLLGSAVRTALYRPNAKAGNDSTVLGPVRDRFWAETEQDFYRSLRTAADRLIASAQPDAAHATRDEWRKVLRRSALAIFDDTVPIEGAESDRIELVIRGRRMLGTALEGYGKPGEKLFGHLDLPLPEQKPKKGRKGP